MLSFYIITGGSILSLRAYENINQGIAIVVAIFILFGNNGVHGLKHTVLDIIALFNLSARM
jgi:hypothetical protein